MMIVCMNVEGFDVVSVVCKFEDMEGGDVFFLVCNNIFKLGNWLCSLVLKCDLLDLLMGFFIICCDVFLCVVLYFGDVGFKILLDILYFDCSFCYVEVLFDFGVWFYGELKFDLFVVWIFLMFLLSKVIGGIFLVKLVFFLVVGVIGLLVYFVVFYVSFVFGVVFVIV